VIAESDLIRIGIHVKPPVDTWLGSWRSFGFRRLAYKAANSRYLPGRKNQELLQLSGGERALTALALLFAMLRVKPSPFVVLDEIDAPLDEANVGRYCDVLRDFTATTQFLTITHNKGTMEAADVLYGVTMEKAGVSKIVSVRLSEGHHAHAEPTLAGVSDQNGPYRNEMKKI
jgi:DNA repair ATPase RecN